MINLNRFDLATLRLYVAVVDAGSLTAGADRFGISLAAASKRIAELEQHCGVTLLQRSQRGVSVTGHGQTLHSLAIEVVTRVEQLGLAVDDFHSGTAGHVRLWANPSSLAGFLPPLLSAYAAENPDVKIDLEDALSQAAARAVLTGVAEVAVIGENTAAEGLTTFVADLDHLVLLAPRGHPLVPSPGRALVTLDAALDHDFVMLARSASLTRQVAAEAEARGRLLRIRVQVRSFDTMCRMVACGMGLAILPRSAAALYGQALGLSVIDLEGFDTRRRLVVATRDRRTLTPAVAALVDKLEDHAVQAGLDLHRLVR